MATVIVTANKTYDISSQYDEITDASNPNTGAMDRVVPANWNGKNDSDIPLIAIRINNGGELSSRVYELLIDESKNTVTFSQIGPDSLNLGFGVGSPYYSNDSYNGKYYIASGNNNGIGQNPPGYDYYLFERGVEGFTIINPQVDSNGIDLLLSQYEPLNIGNLLREKNVISLEDGTFLLTGNFNSSIGGSYALIYDPESKQFTRRFNYDVKAERPSDQNFSDYYGCETDDPNPVTPHLGTFLPKDQFNDRGEFMCKNIKDIRVSDQFIKGRYGNWFLYGMNIGYNDPLNSADKKWRNSTNLAWNNKTFESTGKLSCNVHTKPQANAAQVNGICEPKYNSNFRNFMYSISLDGRKFTRYNLDDGSEAHIDITDLSVVVSDNFEVFKDLVMIDVTQASDGDRVWLEINFDDNQVYERGIIEDAGQKVVKFVGDN